MQAALRTFHSPPSLPLDANAPQEAGAHAGRKRLVGAFFIETGRIRPDPGQPRRNFATEAQRELADSIRRLGILQPITVRYLVEEDVYQILTGERRFQAARELGLAEIPCWVQQPKEQDVLLVQIVENWQREDLHPFDLADALAFLRDANGYSQKQVAELTGKPESEISRILSLLKLNPAAQREARQDQTGVLTRRHLLAVAQLPQEEHQEMLNTIRATGLTAQDTERLVQEKKQATTTGTRRGAPAGKHFRFTTAKALVTVHFRKREVTEEDILAALEEVKAKVSEKAEGNS